MLGYLLSICAGKCTMVLYNAQLLQLLKIIDINNCGTLNKASVQYRGQSKSTI